MAAPNINTGVTIEASASLPATYDTTGYEAVEWTAVGEVIDVSEIAKVWATINHQAVTRAYPVKLKDTYDISDVTLTLVRVGDDAGQVILKTGLDAAASYSFQVTLPSGEIGYFTGKITKCGTGAIASGSYNTLSVTIAVDPATLVEDVSGV